MERAKVYIICQWHERIILQEHNTFKWSMAFPVVIEHKHWIKTSWKYVEGYTIAEKYIHGWYFIRHM